MDDRTRCAALVEESWRRMDYRPVAVAILFDRSDAVLLAQSAKNPDEWLFPQGGIDRNEPADAAVRREVYEELRITLAESVPLRYIGAQDLDAERSRADRRGFARGKRYLFFAGRVLSPAMPQPDLAEIADARWLPVSDVPALLSGTRAEKRTLLLRYLVSAGAHFVGRR